MKQYYFISNVSDRNAAAKKLANGEKFDVWFTSGTVRHYDERGDLISVEAGEMDWEAVDRIDPTECETVYVRFNFGSYVYIGVTIHEGLTLDECVCLRGQGAVETYKDPQTGEWVKCEAEYEATLEKLGNLRKRVDDSEIASNERSKEEESEEMTTVQKIEKITEAVKAEKTRSAWKTGVKAYALEILEEMKFNAEHGYVDEDEFSNSRMLEKALLNGAQNWKEYSWGGCALIYDGDIAERLCNRTELKRTRNGQRKPNSREEWLDTQARALSQACAGILWEAAPYYG